MADRSQFGIVALILAVVAVLLFLAVSPAGADTQPKPAPSRQTTIAVHVPRTTAPRPSRDVRPANPQPAPSTTTTPVPPPFEGAVIVEEWPTFDPVAPARCDDALICALDRWDDFVAWQIVRWTGIPYYEVAYERLDGWSWYALVDRLEIERATFYGALEIDDWSSNAMFTDRDVLRHVRNIVGYHQLPVFACEPVPALPPLDPKAMGRPRHPDHLEEIVLYNLADQTLWCDATLWRLYLELGSWAGVAHAASITPYAFDAIFDVSLYVHGSGIVEYPTDGDVYAAIEADPERWEDPDLLTHVWNGMKWVGGGVAKVVSVLPGL